MIVIIEPTASFLGPVKIRIKITPVELIEKVLPIRPGTSVECGCKCPKGWELHLAPPAQDEHGNLLSILPTPTPSPPCTEDACLGQWCTKVEPTGEPKRCNSFVKEKKLQEIGKSPLYDGMCTTAGWPGMGFFDAIGHLILSGGTPLVPGYPGASPGASTEMDEAATAAKAKLLRELNDFIEANKKECDKELCKFRHPYSLELVQYWCVDVLSPRPPEHYNHVTNAHYKLTAYFFCEP